MTTTLLGEDRIMAHFIVNGEQVWKKWIRHVPLKGQMVRRDNEFYTVENIVWCPWEQHHERVNIQLTLNSEH